MNEKSIVLETLPMTLEDCIVPVENMVLAVSYFFAASYYLMLAIDLLMC